MGAFRLFENGTTPLVDHLVHQVDQIALLVVLLVLLGELFDHFVDELAQGCRLVLVLFATLMQQLKEFSQVFFTVLISVWLINETKSANENLKALVNGSLLQLCVEEELLEYSNGRQTEVTIA